MSTIRVIRPLPEGLTPTVAGISWGDAERYVDYLTTGNENDVPADAVYAAMLDDFGMYSELVAPPMDLVFIHHYAGWNPEDFPQPSL